MKSSGEQRPAAVAATPQQAGDTLRQRWGWVEPSVWTERMLTALETTVKGGKWFRLIDKVENERNLQSAFDDVWRNDGSPGVDGQSVAQFEFHRDKELARLASELHGSSFRPHPARRVYIPKPGRNEKRPLGIPAVRDRVVQAALKHVIEPIFEREFAVQSYGYRRGRGCKEALRRVASLLKEGHTFVVDADLKSYFDTIPHERLMKRVQERIADGRVLALIESFLRAGVLEEMKGWQPSESGTPQGAVISPLLANIYLNPLDHSMAAAGYEMVRYADDFVILCRTQSQAEEALAKVQAWVSEARLTLHPEKTRIVDATLPGGFDFLGYHFERGMKWPHASSIQKLKEGVRPHVRRISGQSLGVIVVRINPILRGWFGYFQHSKANTFGDIDQWVRGRLRSILRKRRGGKGRGRGADHQRWPNAYFAGHGLYTLWSAYRSARQPHV